MTRSLQKPLPDNTKLLLGLNITPAGFESAMPGSERLQTHTLDRTATGIGLILVWVSKLFLARVGLCSGVFMTMCVSYRSFLSCLILISSVRIYVFVLTYVKSFQLNFLVLWIAVSLLHKCVRTCVRVCSLIQKIVFLYLHVYLS